MTEDRRDTPPMWRRRAALLVGGVWALVSLARVSLLGAPVEAPPGQDVAPMLDFLRTTIPPESSYLLVLPAAPATDTGSAPRLRYELYPRKYDDVRASEDEAPIRRLIQAEGLRFVVVPDASQYPASSWLRQPAGWLRRIELDPNRYVLEVLP